MSVYIKGIKMPTEGWHKVIKIFSDGTVVCNYDGVELGKAVPVPMHGRLGDLDELYSRLAQWYQTYERAFSESEAIYIRAMLAGVKETPTIISSSKEEV